jgi:hypothetical protein
MRILIRPSRARHASSGTPRLSFAFFRKSTNRSFASSRRFNGTSSALSQFGLDFFINRELPTVDDSHVETCADAVKQKAAYIASRAPVIST